MLCLVIEDSEIKLKAIIAFMESEFPDVKVDVERSYQAGLKRAIGGSPDFIILDMTLPNFDVVPGVRHGKPRPLGGYELMRKIKRRGIAADVFVVTQYESFGIGPDTYTIQELEVKCVEELPGIFRGMVYFSSGNDNWKISIRGIIAAKMGGGCENSYRRG